MELVLQTKSGLSVRVDAAIDPVRHIVHAMDIEVDGPCLKEVFPQIRESLAAALRLYEPEPWSWYVYDWRGSISRFRGDKPYFVALRDPSVYPAFIKEMLIRSNRISLSI